MTLTQLARTFEQIALEGIAIRETLEELGVAIQARAHDKYGEYQPQVGRYPAWAPLAPSTVAAKEHVGEAPPDNPLVADGTLRDSLEHAVHGVEAVEVGTDVPYAIFHEFGTTRMPPRPVLGPAALETIPRFLRPLAAATIGILVSVRTEE